MKRLLLVAIAVVAAFAARPAISADLPMAPVYKSPPPIVPVYSWTGCYLGGNAGGGWSSWTYSNPTDNPTIPGTRGDIQVSDIVAGGQVGCDYQVGGIVLGVQGMFDWSPTMKGRFFDAVTGAFDQSAQARWFATATGRIGATITPATLFYLKGGAAWVRNQYEDIQVFGFCGGPTGCNTVDASPTATQLGWTVGIGGEYMFAPNWSVFVEYNYLNFGTANVNFAFPAGSIPASNTFEIAQHIQTIVAGVNYRFNFGGAPIAPRY